MWSGTLHVTISAGAISLKLPTFTPLSVTVTSVMGASVVFVTVRIQWIGSPAVKYSPFLGAAYVFFRDRAGRSGGTTFRGNQIVRPPSLLAHSGSSMIPSGSYPYSVTPKVT